MFVPRSVRLINCGSGVGSDVGSSVGVFSISFTFTPPPLNVTITAFKLASINFSSTNSTGLNPIFSVSFIDAFIFANSPSAFIVPIPYHPRIQTL